MSVVSELAATTDIQPNEGLQQYVARQLQRSPEDWQVDSYVHEIRKFTKFAGEEYARTTPEGERMGDYWLQRVRELLNDVEALRPAPVEFLSSVPASAGATEGQI